MNLLGGRLSLKRRHIVVTVGFCLLLGLAVAFLSGSFTLLHEAQQQQSNGLLEPARDFSGSLPWNSPQRFFALVFVATLLALTALSMWKFRRHRFLVTVAGAGGILLALAVLSPWSPLAATSRGLAEMSPFDVLKGPFSPLAVALFLAWILALLACAVLSAKHRWAKRLYFVLLFLFLPLLLSQMLPLFFSRPSSGIEESAAAASAALNAGQTLQKDGMTAAAEEALRKAVNLGKASGTPEGLAAAADASL